MFAGRRSCIEWQAIPQQRNWAKSTKLAQTSTWAHLTNTGKVLAWPGIEPGTFFCHGRCSNHWATAPCPEMCQFWLMTPILLTIFPTFYHVFPGQGCNNTCPKPEWLFHSISHQNLIFRWLTHMHLCILLIKVKQHWVALVLGWVTAREHVI